MKIKNLILLILGFIIIESCNKEGTGGKASISGIIYEEFIDRNGNTVEIRIAQDKKVFIKYGDNNIPSDDTETVVDGKYEFNYLTKGKYKVYTYSECRNCNTGNQIEEKIINIESRNDKINQDINTTKIVSPEDGNSIITGRILIQRYLGATPFGDPYIAQNTDVFIKYDNEEVHFEKTETGADGKFAFRDLIIGSYKVYAYSICDTCSVLLETIEVNTSISENESTVDIGDIIVETP
tara:strand:+ start:12080 stop:12793 length:714 start_codon:yes stop_codon:yes gene_type:complete